MNARFELSITEVAYRGAGVGRKDNFVYFVPGCLQGETVLVEETSKKKNYGTARLVKVLRSSQDRIEPECPFAVAADDSGRKRPVCPGCAYQHVGYAAELEIKNRQFSDFIKRTAGADAEKAVGEPVASPMSAGYRNKITLHKGLSKSVGSIGYYGEDNRTIIDITHCNIANCAINELYMRMRPRLLETARPGDDILFRHTKNGGAFCRTGRGAEATEYLCESTLVGDFRVDERSFFQINPGICDCLLKKMMETVDLLRPSMVVDAFCGCGIFSVAAGKMGTERVFGMDTDWKSVRTAKLNAVEHRLGNCQFQASPAEIGLTKIIESTNDKDGILVVLDPPRSGLSAAMTEKLVASGVRHIAYISCAPDTLARDLKILSSSGFKLKDAQLFDMFPRTQHFESFVVLEK